MLSWEDALESVLKLLREANSSSFTTAFVLDIETGRTLGGKRERGLGTGFLKCPSWLVVDAVEKARVWIGALLFVWVETRGALGFGGAFAAALRLILEVVLVLSIEPDAACLRLGTLDFGTGSRDRGLGSLEATCGSSGGEESILCVECQSLDGIL